MRSSRLCCVAVCDVRNCALTVSDLQIRRGMLHLPVHGKGNKLRYITVHPATVERINAYLERAGHREDLQGAIFRAIRDNVRENCTRRVCRTLMPPLPTKPSI